MYSKFTLLAAKDCVGKWHYLVNYVIRNGRVIGMEYGKPNHMFIGSLKEGWRVAKVNQRYGTIKLF